MKSVIEVFWNTQKVLYNYDAIKRVAFENVEDLVNDGVVLAELRFAPNFIAENKDRQTVYNAIAKQQGTAAELVAERRAIQIAEKEFLS